MPVPSNIKTAEAALIHINSGKVTTSVELIDLALQMRLDVADAKSVLLYSGNLQTNANGVEVQAWSIAEAIGETSPSNAKVATIGQTEFSKLMGVMVVEGGNEKSVIVSKLTDLIAKENGWSSTDLRTGAAVERIINGETVNGVRTTPGLWDERSVKFIEVNVKAGIPINTLTPTAGISGTFTQAEIDAMLKSPAPSIDGQSKAVYQQVYDKAYTDAQTAGKTPAESRQAALGETQKAVRSQSFFKSVDVEYTKNPGEKKITSVDPGPNFFDGVTNPPPRTPIPDGTPNKGTVSQDLGNMTNQQWKELIDGQNNITKQKGVDLNNLGLADTPPAHTPGQTPDPTQVPKGIKALVQAGIIGDILGIYLVGRDAQAAYERGDLEGAAKIIANYAAGTIGGVVVGGALIAGLAFAMPLAGTAGVLAGLVAGITGGMIGDVLGQKALEALLKQAGLLGILPEGGIAELWKDLQDLLGKTPTDSEGKLPDWLLPADDRFGDAPNAVSPLVLDLDGDGIETIAMGYGDTASSTYFDLDNDGFAERTGWISGGDGLLAIDKNSNGKIDNQAELFGNSATQADGFAALAALDSNRDGKITSADSQWSKLRVWVDADKDGITDAGELKTLANLKITQINLTAQAENNLYNNENPVTASSTFVMNGQTRTVSDVWFRNDQTDTRYTGDVTLNVKTLFLPTLRGFGQLKDLHIAMSQDSSLLTLIENFTKNWSVTKFANGAALDTELKAILYKWAGVEGVTAGSRGIYADAQKVSFMEKLTGQNWGGGATPANPAAPGQGRQTEESFEMAFSAMKAQLIAQVAGNTLFAQAPSYDFATGEMVGGVLNAANVTAFSAQAPASNVSTTVKMEYWKYVANFLLSVKDYSEFTAAETSLLDTAIKNNINSAYSFENIINNLPNYSDSYNGTQFSDYIGGTRHYDALSGQAGNDILSAKEGDDYIDGGEGKDILIGGIGNDTLYGGTGDDTYIYEAGDGLDAITDYDGNDTLRIKGDYIAADISFAREDEQNLEVFLKGQKIATIKSYFGGYVFDKIALDNGTTIDVSQFRNVQGDSADNVLNGIDHALMKSDYIYGGYGNDTLNGKVGNDYLFGGYGDDKYVYSNGITQGSDIIRDDNGAADSISLGSSYTASNVTFERVGSADLAIKSGGKTLITILNQFSSNGSIEKLIYGNGTSLNLLTYSHTLNGTEASDSLYGTSYGAGGDKLNGLGGDDRIYSGAGNDIVTGGDGNDYIYGDDGNDTLSGNSGNDYIYGGLGNDTVIYESGLDRISDSGGTDIIQINNAAITAANMMLRRNPGNQGDLDILLNGAHAFTIQGQFYKDGEFETIKFANGTTFNLSNVQYTTTGTTGGDTLYGISYGGNPNDVINGGAGDDYLYGYDGNDTLDGGTGADRLYGGKGNDIYKVSLNSGIDRITDEVGTDTIQFGAGFSKSNMTLLRDPVNKYDLNILFGGSIAVIIENHFQQGGFIETLKFSDGSTYSLAGVSQTQNGTDQNDTIYGHDGIDIINGVAGNDSLYGYGGNDTLNGGAGRDYLYGGTGNDTYLFSTGFGDTSGSPDYVSEEAGEGTDTVKFTTLKSTDVYAWSENGGFYIQSKTNVNDIVRIYGYVQNESMDIINRVEKVTFADNVAWTLSSGLTIQDSDEGHYIYGSSLNDTFKGNGGNDYIYAYAGNDTLDGGAGRDYLYGGTGDDTYLFGTGFGDTNGSADYVSEEAGQGTDTVKFTTLKSTDVYAWSENGGFYIQSKTNSNDLVRLYSYVQNESMDIISRIEKVTFADNVTWTLSSGLTVQDSEEGHSIYGSSLNDTFKANGGNDYVYAYAGNDTLDGGAGRDYLYGGTGNDTYLFSTGFGDTSGSPDYVSEEAGEGTDIVKFTTLKSTDVYSWSDSNGLYIQSKTNINDIVRIYGYVQNDSLDVGSRIEKVMFADNVAWTLSSGLTIQDSDEGHYIYGSSLNDTFKGNGGNDYIYAYAGNDTLDGGAGRDYLYGGTGDDTYLFGTGGGLDYVSDTSGVDTLKLAAGYTTENISVTDYSSYDTKIIGSAGVDEVQISSQRYTAGTNQIEKLAFSDGFTANLLSYNSWIWGATTAQTTNGTANADTVFGRGGNDTISGAAGDDALHGGSGNDTVRGGDGNDIIHGGIGNDNLYGDAGNDTLYGDDGLDNLWGGTGADSFMFMKETAFKNIDVINDFSKTQGDKINIANLLQGYDPLTKAITDFVQITTSGTDSILKIDADGGANGFVQIATIKGVTGLTDEAAVVTNGNLIAA